MKIPERACRLKLDIQADTPEEMVRALESIATAIDRSELSTGCSGGVHSGWTYEYVKDDGPSHEEYQRQLKAYVAATRAEKETSPARDETPPSPFKGAPMRVEQWPAMPAHVRAKLGPSDSADRWDDSQDLTDRDR